MEANHEQEYPRPPSLPEDKPWPPDFDLYRDKTDPKAKSDERSKEAFNEDLAREAFGDAYLDDLVGYQDVFAGDWWQLALLKLTVDVAVCDKRTDKDRLAVWNRMRSMVGSDIKIHLERAHLWGVHLAHAHLRGAHLAHAGLMFSDLRLTKIEDAVLNHGPPKGWSRWKVCCHRLTDWLDWDRVRKVGRLQLLTRASYWVVLGVPILSALWGPARMWISTMNGAMAETRSELRALQSQMPSDEQIVTSLQAVEAMLTEGTLASTLPLSLLLAFCAAFCVAVGHFIYQVFTPQLIAEHSEADLVEQAEEINRRDQEISEERLRQAISHLQSAAAEMPHRCHAWLVKRDRRVVWLPHNLDWYADHPDSTAAKTEKTQPTEESSSKEKPQQEVTGEDRKRIAIEEGERAKYRQAAYEKRSWAWVSGNLYIVGGLLLLAIVLIQLGHVSQAAGAGMWLGWLGWVGQKPLVWLSAFWFLLFPIAGVVALNWERICGWFVEKYSTLSGYGAKIMQFVRSRLGV